MCRRATTRRPAFSGLLALGGVGPPSISVHRRRRRRLRPCMRTDGQLPGAPPPIRQLPLPAAGRAHPRPMPRGAGG
eukprot:scaffold5560_cov444-Prasinococcus_capsulatus_cf.AAC.1